MTDFGYLLSKIRDTPPISQSFLILLRHSQVDPNLLNAVDHVIQLNPPYNTKNDCKTVPKKPGSKKQKISVHFQRLDSNQVFTLKTRRKNSVYSLRQEVYRKYKGHGITIPEIMIFRGKTNLKNDKLPISSYNVNDGDTLVWSLKKDESDLNSMEIENDNKSDVDVKSTQIEADTECEETKTEEIYHEQEGSLKDADGIRNAVTVPVQDLLESNLSNQKQCDIATFATSETHCNSDDVADSKSKNNRMLRLSSTELADELSAV